MLVSTQKKGRGINPPLSEVVLPILSLSIPGGIVYNNWFRRLILRLVDLAENSWAVITGIEAGQHLRRRLFALGMVVGARIYVKAVSPFKGPIICRVDGRDIMIRRGQARHILVNPIADK